MKNLKNIIIFIIWLNIYFDSCFGQSDCKTGEWKCKDGQCIQHDELCDGHKHCSDGSDEISESCLDSDCPSFSFKCSYGACVGGSAKCNNIKDCYDNSDEADCNKTKVCPEESFKCDSDECISIDLKCDGEKNCLDGSDETTTACSDRYCPAFAFQCEYGACINGEKKCDGVKDCIDGSDESVTICPTITPGPNNGCLVTSIPYLIVKTDNDNSEEIQPGNYVDNYHGIKYSCPKRHLLKGSKENHCLYNNWTEPLPMCISNENGCLVTYKSSLIVETDDDNPQEIQPGNYVDEFYGVKYSCQKRHLLKGSKKNRCLDNKWTDPLPMCIKYCPNDVLCSVTIQPICDFKGTIISCQTPILPGTRASISCQNGYLKPFFGVRENVYCEESGDWDYAPYRCEQDCGEEHPDFTIFSLGSTNTNNTRVPWNVGIYSSIEEPNKQVCGGTIISAKIVISAAHCFWNVSINQKNDKSYYKVGAGKYYRNYDAIEPLPIQLIEIEEIHITDGYQDIQFSYMNDIAAVVLKQYLKFSFYIKPACLKWREYSEIPTKSNLTGRVAGWGKTATGLPSNELNVVELSTLSYDDCKAITKKEYKAVVTSDKFCSSSKDGRTVCQGDSGAGFLIPVYENGVTRFVLEGIVSNGINSNVECTGNFQTAYTNIQHFKAMVVAYMTKYKVE